MKAMTYDSWKLATPPEYDDDGRDEYHKLAEERYERELEEQLDQALKDHEGDPNTECAWESRF